MIIDAKTVVITLLVVTVALYGGLKLVRSFALSIAQENHDANQALDAEQEEQRLKRERDADARAATAFAKVEPLLTVPKSSSPSAGQPEDTTTSTATTPAGESVV